MVVDGTGKRAGGGTTSATASSARIEIIEGHSMISMRAEEAVEDLDEDLPSSDSDRQLCVRIFSRGLRASCYQFGGDRVGRSRVFQ